MKTLLNLDVAPSPSLIEQIIEVVSEISGLPRAQLHPEFDLVESGVVDSLQVLQIVGALERRFGIRIDLEEVFAYTTLQGIAEGMLAAMGAVRRAPVMA